MKILDKSYDNKIKADCYLIKTSLEKYYEIAKLIIHSNKLQRKRVLRANNVYGL